MSASEKSSFESPARPNTSSFCCTSGLQHTLHYTRGFHKFLMFNNGGVWENTLGRINKSQKKYCIIIFYIRGIKATLEFFQFTQGWLWYSQIFKQEVGLSPQVLWTTALSDKVRTSRDVGQKGLHKQALRQLKIEVCVERGWGEYCDKKTRHFTV